MARKEFGYKCSEADKCPNQKCSHRIPHIPGYLFTLQGNYQTCANQFLYCTNPNPHVYKKCDLIGRLSPEPAKR